MGRVVIDGLPKLLRRIKGHSISLRDSIRLGEIRVGLLPVQHVDEVEETVQHGHHQVGHAQVYQKVVRDGPHPPVGCNKCDIKC